MGDEAAAAAAAAPAAGRAGPPQSRAKAWCFTWNNPTHRVLFPDGLPGNITYLVYQLERGKEGTEHLQGYVRFKDATRFNQVKLQTFNTPEGVPVFPFNTAHLEVARGKPEENKAYCTKAETRVQGPWELGELPKGQGERSDLREAAVSLMADGDIRKVDPSVFLKYSSGCLKLAALAQPPRRDGLKIITIVGPTGIGKSFSVHDLFPDVYVVNMGNSGLWWDGYTGQPAVLFEEFKGQVQLQKMLQILDPYPLRLEVKGGLVPARFTLVFITSNYTYDKWYKNEAGERDPEFEALARRLDAPVPSRVPPKPAGVRYIHCDARDELHKRLDRALSIEGLRPRPGKRLSPLVPIVFPAAPAPVVVAAAAEPHSPSWKGKTPEIPDGQCQFVAGPDGAPMLKRHKAQIIVINDSPDEADMATDENGDCFVRSDIADEWQSAAPNPVSH